MIPRIIHYCWFGRGPMDAMAERCIESWKRMLPDYEIRLWNEDNFDVNSVPYVKEAYENRKYAFVSDYVRVHALYEEGGIYFDTDLEVLQNLDEMLVWDFVAGFESVDRVATCLLMARKHSLLMKKMREYYRSRTFIKNGRMDMTTNVEVLTGILASVGLEKNGLCQELTVGKERLQIRRILDFCPYSMGDKVKDSYPDSYAVHWCEGSWVSGNVLVRHRLIRIIKKVLGDQNYRRILDTVKGLRRGIRKN